MEYLKQNASGLYVAIQQIGCFFRTALHVGELVRGQALTVSQINRLWNQARAFRFINDQNIVVNSAGIINLAIRELNGREIAVEVLTREGDREYWYGTKNRTCEYWIKKIAQNGPNKTHFVNVDQDEELIWDPHEPQIKDAGKIRVIGYQIRRP